MVFVFSFKIALKWGVQGFFGGEMILKQLYKVSIQI